MRIFKKFSFDASHQLHWHDGKCANLHGHTYFVEVCIEGNIKDVTAGPKKGFVMDFHDLKRGVNETIIEKYDHKHLNDFFKSPTAELMSIQMYRDLASWLNDNIKSVTLHSLKLWETPTSYVEVDFQSVQQHEALPWKDEE